MQVGSEPYMPYTAQHILHGPSGLPEDRYINVFRFISPDPGTWTDDDVADSIAWGLEDFFSEPGTGSFALESFLSRALLPAVTIKVYNDEDLEPREPIERTYTQTRSTENALPSEVALCLSYHGNRNIPRERGRIYIGPLNLQANGFGAAGTARPNQTVIDTLVLAGTRLATRVDPTGPQGLRWAVRSAGPYADGSGAGVVTHTAITRGWVDNAFDTQRRRGEAAGARTEWTVGS